MYYYLYRFYDPNLQRWIGRDPVTEAGSAAIFAVSQSIAGSQTYRSPISEEQGDINLYGFVANNPGMFVDIYGLDWKKWLPWNWPWHQGPSKPDKTDPPGQWKPGTYPTMGNQVNPTMCWTNPPSSSGPTNPPPIVPIGPGYPILSE
jgi:RHS repeat-associated protein